MNKLAVAILEDFGRQYERGVRRRALRTERDASRLAHRETGKGWRIEDVKRLLHFGGWAPTTQHWLERLLADKERRMGKPALNPPPKKFSKAVVDGWSFYKQLWHPATPVDRRRECIGTRRGGLVTSKRHIAENSLRRSA